MAWATLRRKSQSTTSGVDSSSIGTALFMRRQNFNSGKSRQNLNQHIMNIPQLFYTFVTPGLNTVKAGPVPGQIRFFTLNKELLLAEGAHRVTKSALDGHGNLPQIIRQAALLVLRQSREEAAETDRQKVLRATELF
jgi:hypothetical protein